MLAIQVAIVLVDIVTLNPGVCEIQRHKECGATVTTYIFLGFPLGNEVVLSRYDYAN